MKSLCAFFLLAWLLEAQSPDQVRDLLRDLGIGSEPVSLIFRNLSQCPASEAAKVRAAIESQVRQDPHAAAELRVTLTQSLTETLLVCQFRRGEEDRVAFLPLPRLPAVTQQMPAAVFIGRTPLLQDPEQILDVARAGADLLVLLAARVSIYRRQNGRWTAAEWAALPARIWPRDLRGRIQVQDTGFQAWLPGMVCSGSWQPALTLNCRDAEEPWPGPLPATVSRERSYFKREQAPPFFSAAAAGDALVLTTLDGHARVFDKALRPAGTIAGWGSDIAGLALRCGNGALVAATRGNDAGERDAVQVWEVADSTATSAGPRVEFPGPVTALWPAGANELTAVARNTGSGLYEAHALTVSCSH